jgi:hypothetical protein
MLAISGTTAAGARRITNILSGLGFPSTTHWQGIHNTGEHLWLIQTNQDRPDHRPSAREDLKEFAIQEYNLRLFRAYRGDLISESPVANFVMRSLDPASVESLVPKILTQAELILERSACLSFALFEVDGSISDWLGVTTWPDLAAFNSYALWAATHPWSEVISPNTLAVPLRLLTRQVKE